MPPVTRTTLRLSMLLLPGLVVAAVSGSAQRGGKPAATASNPAEATARIVAAAQAVVSTLDEAGKAKLQFPFDGPQKTGWSNLPTGIFERQGLRMGDLTPPQRTAVMNLLQAALSADGYRKVIEIIRGDEVLRTTDGGRGPRGGGPPAGGGPGGTPPAGAAPAGPPPVGERREPELPRVVHQARAAGGAVVVAAAVWCSAKPSTTSRSSARRRRARHGCCSSAAITSRST